MRRRSWPAHLASFCLLAALLCSCGPPRTGEPGAPSFQRDSGGTDADLMERGRAITAEAVGLLAFNLTRAMAERGPAHALEFCSEAALPLTEEVAAENRVTLRRVSHRPRNPRNRAGPDESAVLERFAAVLGEGGKPDPVLVRREDGSAVFYAPILLASDACLKCHGQPGTEIDAATLQAIERAYPDDRATGFRREELRGMWRVEFPPLQNR